MEKTIAPKKVAMFEKTQKMFSTYDKFMFMNLHKVQSTQFKNIKNEFPEDVKFLFAKNKIMKKALEKINNNGKFNKALDLVKGNIIVAFFNSSESANIVYNVCQKFRCNAFARFGDKALEDVIVPEGPTGLGPDQIQLFHAAKINTKIVKGKIEIAVSHKLISAGEVVGISEANILAKLGIKPFNFGLDILKVFEGNDVYDKNVLAITEEEITQTLKDVIGLVSSVSLGLDEVNESSVPYAILNAYNEVVKVSKGIEYSI